MLGYARPLNLPLPIGGQRTPSAKATDVVIERNSPAISGTSDY